MSDSDVAGLASEAPTAAQMAEFYAQVQSGRVTKTNFQIFLRNLDGASADLPDIDWAKVYAALGMSAEYEAQNSLDMTQPGSWIVPVLRDVTANKLVAALRGLGVAVYTYVNDLDANVPTNLRDPKNGPYAVRFKKTVEADPEFANLSANDCKQKKISSITLIERLLLEVGYFMTTGKHLDEKNVTLCAGSRHSGGLVPFVGWDPGARGVYVDWYLPAK